MVLDGDPARGMPGYRSNVYVSGNLDDIYRYFVARAEGAISAEYRPPATGNDGDRCVTNDRVGRGSGDR
jgi:hypothetical protein